MSFALTKIQPPRRRSDLLERPALDARLAAALAAERLVLVCAPAGYGKTAWLSQQIGRVPAGTATAWIACDADDDLPRLASCLVEALEPFDLPWRTLPAALIGAMGRGVRAPRDAFAAELLNALAATDVARGLIVFDDLHSIQDPAVAGFLELLIDRLPPHWGIVIAARHEPSLPLARWRAHGEMREFRETDLALTLDEIGTLIGTPDAARARALLQRTGGWAVGVRLGLGAGTMPGAASSQRHLFDYLASEVLDRLEPGLQDFLLRSAVLAELDEAACSAVTGDPRAAHWLDEIERRGLFTSTLDGAVRTLRLHDLFRDFLEDRLRRRHPGEFAPLLRRAAAVERDAARRVGLLLRAGDVDAATQALLDATPELLLAGRLGTVLRLQEQFPAEARAASARLAFVRGLTAWPRWEWTLVRQAMAQAAAAPPGELAPALVQQALAAEAVALIGTGRIDEAPARLEALRGLPLDRDSAALAELTACWISAVHGPVDAPGAQLRRMVALLDAGAAPATWLRCVPSLLFMGRPGVAAAVEDFVRGALIVAGDTHLALAAAAHGLDAWTRLWRGEFDAADAALHEAETLARWLAAPRNLQINSIWARLIGGALRGHVDGFGTAVATLVADVENDPTRRATWYGVYVVLLGQFAAGLEAWDLLRDLLARLERQPDAAEWPTVRNARALLQALRAEHEGDDEAVCRLLEDRVDTIDAHALVTIGFGLRITLALAQARRGRYGDALHTIAPALKLAADERLALPLLALAPKARAQLAAARWLDPLPAPVRAWLLRHCSGPLEIAAPELPAAAQADETARLTAREREVLARIAAGQSNKLIAKTLDLSPHTVKRHVANLLDKTASASRGEAAAWWHAHASASQSN